MYLASVFSEQGRAPGFAWNMWNESAQSKRVCQSPRPFARKTLDSLALYQPLTPSRSASSRLSDPPSHKRRSLYQESIFPDKRDSSLEGSPDMRQSIVGGQAWSSTAHVYLRKHETNCEQEICSSYEDGAVTRSGGSSYLLCLQSTDTLHARKRQRSTELR